MKLDDMDLEMIKHLRKQARENQRKAELNKVVPDEADIKHLVVNILEQRSDYGPSEMLRALIEATYQVFEKNYLDCYEFEKKLEESIFNETMGAINRQMKRNFLNRSDKKKNQ